MLSTTPPTQTLERTTDHLPAPRDPVPAPANPAPAGRLRPRWALELALMAGLYVIYDTTRGLRQGNLATADQNGAFLLRAEQRLHLDPEHILNNLLWHVPALGVAASYFYATMIFVVTPVVLVWLYRRHPVSYRTARTALVIATAMALIVYSFLPTAPPRLLPGSPFHDILAAAHHWGWWGSEGSAPRGLGSATNQLAAMPSLHVGWALWSGWMIARHARRRPVRILGALYPVLTALDVMGTGNHYFVDTVAGATVIALGAALAILVDRRRRKSHPADAPHGSYDTDLPPSRRRARHLSGHLSRSRACRAGQAANRACQAGRSATNRACQAGRSATNPSPLYRRHRQHRSSPSACSHRWSRGSSKEPSTSRPGRAHRRP